MPKPSTTARRPNAPPRRSEVRSPATPQTSRIEAYLPTSLRAQVDEVSRRTRVRLSDYVREGLEYVIAAEQGLEALKEAFLRRYPSRGASNGSTAGIGSTAR